jgi:putative CocE/NonD family hydrolase
MSEIEARICRNIEIPMRDGVVLSSDLYFGCDAKELLTAPRPVILMRTPYNRAFVALSTDIRPFLARGFAFLFQDVRGTGASGGALNPLMNEANDGADTIAWLTRQPWCDGRVATTGASYMGAAQLQLVVNPVVGHETAVLQVPAGNIFGSGMIYDGDMLALETAAPWAVMMGASTLTRFPPETAAAIGDDIAAEDVPFLQPLADGDTFGFLKDRSLRSIPVARHVPFWHGWLDNRENPEFFASAEVNSRLGNVVRPLMHLAGWYDLFLRNTLAAYSGISAEGATPEARTGQRLIVGPWSHVGNPKFRQFPGSDVNDAAASAAWIGHCLTGEANGLFDHPVIIYVMGENRWRAEEAWPCRGAVPTRLYLHSNGGANGPDGNGMLSANSPGESEPADTYRTDPSDPIKSLGGHGLSGGPVDQRPNANRRDILVYTTAVLQEDMEVAGHVRATIYAASSATDTDWFVKLIDVFPDGTAYNILNGGARGRYRHSRLDPAPLTPGEVVAYDVDLQATSNVFKKGHRIRVEISSSDFPNYDLNPNCFVDLSSSGPDDYVVAKQSVFHDAARPSSIELPVIPQGRARNWIATPFPAGKGDRAYSRHDTALSELGLIEIDASALQIR